jgi:RNA polymerase sigma-70 factor, ECF subfamily
MTGERTALEVGVGEKEEAELIRRCVGGDDAAWRTLLHLHHRALYSVAYRVTLHADEAEDAVQESWVRIAKALPRFDGRSSFRTWAIRILVNQAITSVKARRATVPIEETDRIAAPGGAARSREEALDLRDALAALSPEERAAVVLHYAEGYTFKEIAQSLGIPLRTAADHAYRGLRHLRYRLAPENS